MSESVKNTPLPQEVNDAVAAYTGSRMDPVALSKWAAKFAQGHIMVKGIKFHRYSIAHNWCAEEINGRNYKPTQLTAVVMYMLTFDADGVCNTFLPLLMERSPAEMVAIAMAWMVKHKIDVQDLDPVAQLYYHDTTKKKDPEPKSRPSPTRTGGAGSSSSSRKRSGGKKK